MKFVMSRYNGKFWSGVVLDHINWKKSGLSLVLLLKDRNHQPFNRRYLKVLGDGWLEEIDAFDISNVNPDWFKNLPDWRRDYIKAGNTKE